MPRNPSTGVYSKPAGTTPSVGQLIDPVPWNALTTDLGNEITNSLPRDGSAPMVAPIKAADGSVAAPGVGFASNPSTGIYLKAAGVGALVASGVEIANWSASGLTVTGAVSGGVKYATKNANYTAVAADAGTVLRFTAAASLTLTAATTLGAGWPVTVVADGGAVTIDPNASETINGLATLIVPDGTTAEIVCDGTNFFTILRTQPWELIGDYSSTAAAAVSVTNLGAFKRLRITGYMQPSTAAQLLLRTSVNNGSSYDQNSGDYTYYAVYGNGVAANSLNSTTTAVSVGAGATINNADLTGGIHFQILMENFNKGKSVKGLITFGAIAGTNSFAVGTLQFLRNGVVARNAFQLISAGAVNSIWEVLVEGVRG